MAHLLDTNVAIHLRDRDPLIAQRVRELGGELLLSIISRVELENGVYREPDQAPIRRIALDLILHAIPVLPFDKPAADAYRDIVAAAGYSRRKLLDRMIAAQALAIRAVLVTTNGNDFRDIPGLTVLAW